MKTSVMRIILMKVTADLSVMQAPAPCSGQTFYRRSERRVNVRAFVFGAGRRVGFPQKIRGKAGAGSVLNSIRQSSGRRVSSKDALVL